MEWRCVVARNTRIDQRFLLTTHIDCAREKDYQRSSLASQGTQSFALLVSVASPTVVAVDSEDGRDSDPILA